MIICSVQVVFLRCERRTPALPAGYDPSEELHTHPGSARLCKRRDTHSVISQHTSRSVISQVLRSVISLSLALALFQCTATIVILCIGETHNLINYVSFINYLSYGVTIAGLLFYRWKKPNLFRPIKVSRLNTLTHSIHQQCAQLHVNTVKEIKSI